ncbi:MAG: TonB-dependent receptor [Bacteroidia bacterium]|nr:TonB-dependent receptor [Bacteroidia bacterium]
MKIKLIWLLMLATSFIYSQNTLKGNIINSETNETIPFANVYFPELEKGSITNEEGEFKLSHLPNGRFNLVVSSIGFETYSEEITIYDEQLNKIFTLNPSVVEMDEVIVSTPFHKLQADNVMKVDQERVETLKKAGATTLVEGISAIPGVDNISTGNSIGKPVIRGLSSNRVLVYAQGVRLENQQFGAEHGLGVNDAGVESVEVIKGPASLLYGSDALGGVLYLNPERFAHQNSAEGDINLNYFSNTQGKNANIGFKQSSDAFKFLIRGSFSEHADYDTQDYRATNTRFNENDLKIGLEYQKTKLNTEFRYNINGSRLGIPEEIGEQSTNTYPMLPYQAIDNHIFSSKTSIFFDKSILKINLGYIYNDRKEFEEHHEHDVDDHEDEDHDEHEDEEHDEHDEEIFEPALHMKLKTFNYDVKYNLPQSGKFETIVGVQGMHQTNSNYGEEFLIPDATINDIGVLATSHAHFENLALQLGLRYDNRNIEADALEHAHEHDEEDHDEEEAEHSSESLDKSFNSFNGSVGIKVDLGDHIVARANVASGFRSPNLSELSSYGSHHGTNRFEIGNSELDNEQNLQTDLALEFSNKHAEISFNGFYNSINDYIYLSPNGEFIDGDPVYIYLQDNAKLYGGEVGLHLHPHPIHWLHLESSFAMVIGKLDNDEYLPLIPANNLKNTLRVEFDQADWIKDSYLFFKVNTWFDQENTGQFETPTEGYTLFDAGLGGTIQVFKNDLMVTISATNLTDKQYINHLSRLKPDGIFNMGRSINFGLNYKL